MVILHVVAPAPFGGLEEVVRLLCGGLAARQHRVHVAAIVTSGQPEPRLLGQLRTNGAEVHVVRLPRRSYLRERKAIAALCRHLLPDVVHTHGYRPDVLAGATARAHGLPVVTTLHGFTGGNWKNRFYERLQRATLPRCDAVVAVSSALAVAATRAGVASECLTVLPNGWDASRQALGRAAARRALNIAPDALRIGWVGRLTSEKGPDILIDAMARISDVPVSVSMIGDGPEREALRASVSKLGLESRVVWHGVVGDAGCLFPAFDLFVLSSRTEGTPITLFEAMAAQVPVVATAVGGVPAIVSEAEVLLVPPGDSRGLAAAIERALANRGESAARARVARARLEREFGLDRWIERYEAVYRAAIARRAGRRPPPAWTSSSAWERLPVLPE